MKRAQRQELRTVVEEVRAWIADAQEIRHLAEHMPLTGRLTLDRDTSALLQALQQAQDSDDPATASRLTKVTWFDRRKQLQPAHEAAGRLTTFHRGMRAAGRDEMLTKVHADLSARVADERDQLRQVLRDLAVSRRHAARALDATAHMPLTRCGVLTAAEDTAMRSVVGVFALHEEPAGQLLDPATCRDGTCATCHSSAAVLREARDEGQRFGTLRRISAAAERVDEQFAKEQAQLDTLFEQVRHWEDRADKIRRSRADAKSEIAAHVSSMLKAARPAKLESATVRLVPLTSNEGPLLRHLSLLRDAPLSPADDALLTRVANVAQRFIPVVETAFNPRWECSRDSRCIAAHELAPTVHKDAPNLERALRRLTVSKNTAFLSFDDILEPGLGFTDYLPAQPCPPELLDKATTTRARAGVGAIVHSANAARTASAAAKSAAEAVRADDVANMLKAMDLEVLRKATSTKIRLTALANAGLSNVWDVLEYDKKYPLQYIPGLGETSARSVAQAALRLFEAVRDETPVRIDVKNRSKRTKILLEALRGWDAARRFAPTKDELAIGKALAALFKAKPKTTHVLILATNDAVELRVGALLDEALRRSTHATEATDVWTDFLSRPADYFGMLTELGFTTEDEQKMHGDLPEEIVAAVRAKELKRDYLTASLRAYQGFGARFALVQKKVVIGDEMGLGKTVEALAVLAHLRATGRSHFLVVCPAAVVSNWMRETTKHTKLRASCLHGPLWERIHAAKSWLRSGGIAVTTYDLLPWVQRFLAEVQVECAVFDEAHYIKNPTAKRSIAAAEVIESVDYAVLMTGTPLENRVQEFRNLIGYIRPDLSETAPDFLPSKFRKHVAPAYLRRNQEDVLTELPELVEIDEWMGMSDADEHAYRAAVSEGKFMLMRRAAMLSQRSLKMQRLTEIVAEAEDNGRRVIVFSYFREVLAEVARVLPGTVFGPLTGSLRAAERQVLVDRFSRAGGGAALVAQVTAGGIGLNIQSASVVVFCEPQLKPTMESQAVARAHRMGQTNTVQVHRLLTEDSVDERIREILAEKRQLFDEFARDSVIARQAPDAVDMSDAELARVVIAAERERLFGEIANIGG